MAGRDSSDTRTLTIERHAHGVAQVTMSRPEVFNAFDEAMSADLDFAFSTLAEDPDVRDRPGAGKHFFGRRESHKVERLSPF